MVAAAAVVGATTFPGGYGFRRCALVEGPLKPHKFAVRWPSTSRRLKDGHGELATFDSYLRVCGRLLIQYCCSGACCACHSQMRLRVVHLRPLRPFFPLPFALPLHGTL